MANRLRELFGGHDAGGGIEVRELPPVTIDLGLSRLRRQSRWALALSAGALFVSLVTLAVVLTGWLEDCHDDVDLDDALCQFESLFHGGVVTREEWAKTIVDVAAEARAAQNDAPACIRPRD